MAIGFILVEQLKERGVRNERLVRERKTSWSGGRETLLVEIHEVGRCFSVPDTDIWPVPR